MNERVELSPLCQTHQVLLVNQTNYGRDDPWQALLVMVNIALFQGASADPKVHAECGGDIKRISTMGCLACRKPDLFGKLVEVAKTHDLGAVKALGMKWVQEGAKP